MNSIKSKWNSFLTSIANSIKKHWIITIIFAKMSGVWFSLVLTYWGEPFRLIKIIDGSKHFTWIGVLITVVIVAISISTALIEKWAESNKNTITIQAERDLFGTVLVRSSEASQSKLRQQLLELEKMQTGVQKEIPVIYSKPCQQISTILDQLSECVYFLSSDKSNRLKKDDFQISLMYNFVKENEKVWKYANSPNTKGLDESLIMHPNSTASYLINDQKSYVFFNSKERALKAKHYITDANDVRDENGELKGSILAARFLFAINSNTYIRAILCISTHDKKIINETQIRAQHKDSAAADTAVKLACEMLGSNMVDNIIKYFEYQIGSELCNYYIEFLKEHSSAEDINDADKNHGFFKKFLNSAQSK